MRFIAFFLLVLFFSIVDDVIVIFYLRRVVADKILKASLLSMSLGVVQLFGTNFFIEDRIFGLATVIGNGIGTPIAMWYERNHPAEKPRDKKTGRFKPPISPASFQLGDKK